MAKKAVQRVAGRVAKKAVQKGPATKAAQKVAPRAARRQVLRHRSIRSQSVSSIRSTTRIAYDPVTKAFRGTVVNNTSQTVCGSRLEVHMASNRQVIEVGPTIGVDLLPGETLNVVLSTAPITPDTYSLHPESTPCP